MALTLPASLLSQYARFSLYNSPYPAHDRGCAIDLYPDTLDGGRTSAAPSPVSGIVRETRTVRAPQKPYAPECDHVILLECSGPADLEGLICRILHVDPAIEAGDRVQRGDSLGSLVRAGFFAPWVDNHLHVGFRTPDQNLHRASGSRPLALGTEVRPLEWDGTGTVVATGETYAVLDAPTHPNPGEEFVGIGVDVAESAVETTGDDGPTGGDGQADGDEQTDGSLGVLDGGLPHYDGGGVYGFSARGPLEETVSLAGDVVGALEGDDGRTVAWDDVVVTANDDPITGLSTFCARDEGFGAKLVCPDHEFAIDDRVEVRVRSRS
ncbi:hypothetical protein [Natrarchaeobius chitinivorans]|uniref:M23 family metallopeptidase n=1 Tax=Natrarchaeobius chitinivorans TaxID=1679083 RepID=A0A3N6P2H7_NATCH|nr:hypothetical protein [Natrarchaeobius chitinivorans]RQG91799.1 hypothetical protein EA473_18550 [Natrarchaeobius chitinivorans]